MLRKFFRWFRPSIAVNIRNLRQSHSPDALGFVSLTERRRDEQQVAILRDEIRSRIDPDLCSFLTAYGDDNWKPKKDAA